MRILFVADGRSPTTISWISYWISSGDEVHLLSTYACEPLQGLSSFHVINTAFSNTVTRMKNTRKGKHFRTIGGLLRKLRTIIGPISLESARKQYLQYLKNINPDIVHALRIPFEGLLVRDTPQQFPVAISIWGNDITLHAKGSIPMAFATRKTLQRADALFADTRRDINLAREWGLSENAKTMVVPGAGGIRLGDLIIQESHCSFPEALAEEPIIINPRGQRPGSIKQKEFFRAVKFFVQSGERGIFVCPAMQGEKSAEGMVKRLNIQDRVYLWPKLTQPELWFLYSKADIYASPSIHDGTPNSMLEAMAVGCFPVTGNIESMREWITSGENGLLADASDAKKFAQALIKAIKNPALRSKAAIINADLIAERANYFTNMQSVRVIYSQLISSPRGITEL